MVHKSIAEIPVGKVALCGAWMVARWGVDEYDIHVAKKQTGGVFADGKGTTDIRMGLTRESAEALLFPEGQR